MFIKVNEQDEKQLNQFNKIWVACWNEKGYELEFREQAERFIINDENGNGIGTVEFLKYEIGQNSCDGIYPFSELPQVKESAGRIMEIDKVSISKSSRGRNNIARVLYTMYVFAKEKNIRYGVALMEPRFCRAIKKFYKIPLIELTEQKIYKGDWVIPVLIDLEFIVNNLQEYPLIEKLTQENTYKLLY